MKRLYAYQGHVPRFKRVIVIARNTTRAVVAAGVLVLTLTAAMCGGPSIAVLRSGVAAFRPAVQFAIDRGKISADKGKLYLDDADKLVAAYGVLSADWDSARSNSAKAAAIGTFANAIAPITRDFVKIPGLDTAVAILNTTVQIVQAYYSGATPGSAPGLADMPRSDKELRQYLKDQSAALKAALGAR